MTANVALEVVGVPSQVAGRLVDIHKKHGLLRESDVLKDAARKTSPLHAYFEWDDSKAAESHRLAQAASLIRRVQVKVIPAPDTEPIRVRAWVANRDLPHHKDADVESGAYVSIHDVARKTTYEEALADAIRRDLLRLQVKYSSTQTFFDVLRDMTSDE